MISSLCYQLRIFIQSNKLHYHPTRNNAYFRYTRQLTMKVVLPLCVLISTVYSHDLPPSCRSKVYCYGDLLETVQLAHLQNDSKSFVDMKMKQPEKETLKNFAIFKKINNTPTKDQIRQFVNDNFEAGNELENWVPTDYNPNPVFLSKISNKTIRNFASALVKIWPQLGKSVKKEVAANAELYSFIPVPNGFIIPGGRFTEYYYWDSYWIIKGLLISDMNDTARGMIDNFLSLVERYGFVPNGGRVYYLKRSQPPLLTSMAHAYFKKSNDQAWLSRSIKTLEKELNYWFKTQTIHVRGNALFQYRAESAGPRPESYREDLQTAAFFTNETHHEQLYIDLKSGAESGWDFSSRWIFDEQGGTNANLSHIETRRVIPVDLNGFLCGAFKEISELFYIAGRHQHSRIWFKRHLKLRRAIKEILWDEKDQIFYDYDIKLQQARRNFYPSNLAPLWANCFSPKRAAKIGKGVLNYLKNNELLDYTGGIPTSDKQTGEQWDFPNAWPPLQDIVVGGLDNCGRADTKKSAKTLASRWIYSNMLGYKRTGNMFEKYDAVIPGETGGGGEYPPQSGFGWSNGVALEFISKYFSD